MNVLRALLPGILIVASACGSAGRTTMVSIPPPADWEARVTQFRADRNSYLRNSPETPLVASDVETFDGLDYWTSDSGYYFVGTISYYSQPEHFTIITTSGAQRPCEKVGWISFRLDGRTLTLQVYRLLDQNAGYLLPFMDATSGSETYPAGRYVDLLGPDGGPYELDFNRAYNPSCAYGAPERFACPVTPAENRLAVRIEAGERGYKKHSPAG